MTVRMVDFRIIHPGGGPLTSIYLIAAILGVGLIVISSLGIGDTDADAPDTDISHGGGSGSLDLLLGLFSTRNLTFFLAAFGSVGLALTALGFGRITALVTSLALGATAFITVHAVFGWLKRTDASTSALDDNDFDGTLARVVIPVTTGQRGQIACLIAGQEQYLTATLADGVEGPLTAGQEVIILSTRGGVASILPAGNDLLPPSS